jgi:hypothetical protein
VVRIGPAHPSPAGLSVCVGSGIGAQPLNDNESDEQKVPHYSFLFDPYEKNRDGFYAFVVRVPLV